MKIKNIFSLRNYEKSSFWHLVYEWEDGFSETLNIPIVVPSFWDKIFYKISYLIKACTRKLKIEKSYIYINGLVFNVLNSLGFVWAYRLLCKILLSDNQSLVFEMYPGQYYNLYPKVNKVLYFIDFDMGVDLAKFYKMYKHCSIVLISGLEAYNYLKENHCPINIQHVPLSISNKYKVYTGADNNVKYDIIIAGRRNKLLWNYMLEYEKQNKEIEYLYSEVIDGKFYYRSNKRGIIGEFSDRQSYMNLLKECKIAFYSTPGIDETKTKFINHVTSRIFEFISAGCLLIGRYPDNEEVKYFNLPEVCPNVSTFEEFTNLLSRYNKLDRQNDLYLKYSNYLSKHYTSVSAKILIDIIEKR